MHQKIVHDTIARITALCSGFDQKYLHTLVIITILPYPQSWSMVEGVLKYAALSDLEIEDEKTRMNYHSINSAFIVPRPGKEEPQVLRMALGE